MGGGILILLLRSVGIPFMPRFSPGSVGACCCLLAEDNFDRANSSDLGARWTESVGDWSIVSSELTVATSGAVVLHDAAVCGTSVADQIVSCIVKSTAAGDILRIFNGYTSAANWYGLELQLALSFMAGKLRLRSHAGTVRECDVTAYPNTEYKLTLCQRASIGLMTGMLDDQIILQEIRNDTEAVMGIGTGGTLTGTPTFKRFRAEQTNGIACPHCTPCYWPNTTELPSQIEVVITGLADGVCNYSALNGTYVFDLSSESAYCAAYRIASVPANTCGITKMFFGVQTAFSEGIVLRAQTAGSSTVLEWQFDYLDGCANASLENTTATVASDVTVRAL